MEFAMARPAKKSQYLILTSFVTAARVGVPNKVVSMTKSEANGLLKAGYIRPADSSESLAAEHADAVKGLGAVKSDLADAHSALTDTSAALDAEIRAHAETRDALAAAEARAKTAEANLEPERKRSAVLAEQLEEARAQIRDLKKASRAGDAPELDLGEGEGE